MKNITVVLVCLLVVSGCATTRPDPRESLIKYYKNTDCTLPQIQQDTDPDLYDKYVRNCEYLSRNIETMSAEEIAGRIVDNVAVLSDLVEARDTREKTGTHKYVVTGEEKAVYDDTVSKSKSTDPILEGFKIQ